MSWLFYALAGPVLWAISTHLDKYLVVRYFARVHPAVLLVFTGLVNLAVLPLIAVFNEDLTGIGARAIALMVLSGVLLMAAMLLYLRALQSEEASVVAPFFQASPLFAIALSYVVLGERLTAAQFAGAALVMVGTMTAATRFNRGGRAFNVRLAALMLGCALTIALSSLIFKIYALPDDFWTTTFWMFAGEILFAAGILLVPEFRRQFLALLRGNPLAMLGLNAANELVNFGGGVAARYALVLAPLGLVQAVGSTTSIFCSCSASYSAWPPPRLVARILRAANSSARASRPSLWRPASGCSGPDGGSFDPPWLVSHA